MSTTYISNAVALATLVLPLFGLQIADQGTLTDTVTKLMGIAAILYTFYGRYRAGDISAFGLRKV